MKNELAIALVAVSVLIGCSKASITQKDPNVGEYYSFNASDRGYKVLKVLDVTPELIHVCYFNNLFDKEPGKEVVPSLYFGGLSQGLGTYVDGDQTQTRIGRKHVPLTRENWKNWNPRFLDVGVVQPDELAEYNAWTSGDRKVQPGLWTPNQ